jgi:integration host factor subunit beta
MAVNVAIDSMTKASVQGSRIEIRGFGSFRLKDYDQYEGHNPKTGEPIIVAPKRLLFSGRGKSLEKRWLANTMKTSMCR